MMQPEPMTMGPEIAKMVALGCTTVPAKKGVKTSTYMNNEIHTCTYRYITFKLHILTDNSFGVNCKLIASV